MAPELLHAAGAADKNQKMEKKQILEAFQNLEKCTCTTLLIFLKQLIKRKKKNWVVGTELGMMKQNVLYAGSYYLTGIELMSNAMTALSSPMPPKSK